jgi:hypothetical protein
MPRKYEGGDQMMSNGCMNMVSGNWNPKTYLGHCRELHKNTSKEAKTGVQS